MALHFGVALQQQVVVVVSLSWALERLGWRDLWQQNFSNATAPRVPGRVRNGMWQPVATFQHLPTSNFLKKPAELIVRQFSLFLYSGGYLTDLPDVVPHLQHNIDSNIADIADSADADLSPGRPGSFVRATAYQWGESTALPRPSGLILAADCLYDTDRLRQWEWESTARRR